MKYLLLNSLKAGGAERVAQTLSTRGLFDGIILLEVDQDYQASIQVRSISRHSFKTGSLFKTIFIPIYAWRLKKILNKGDTVVSFAERANFVNIFSKLFIKHNSFLTIHTNITKAFLNKKKFLYYLLIKILYPRADIIVCVSLGIKKDLSKIINYKRDIKVIYNPIDFSEISQKSLEVSMLSNICDDKTLITVGRLSNEKAQWNLLKIFRNVLKSQPLAKLIILGDGELKSKLMDYSRFLKFKTFSVFENQDFNASYNVYFLGFQDNPYQFISKSSIFVLTSIFEGLPMTILEAMACGTPVISSDCDFGPREILNNDNNDFGIILPVLNNKLSIVDSKLTSDEIVWSDTIVSLLEDKIKRDSYSKLARVRLRDFSIEKIIIEWQNLLKNF